MTDKATVDLAAVLAAKEQRAQLQASLRSQYGAVVISLTINMPGATKYTADTLALLYDALGKTRDTVLSLPAKICEERILHLSTGPAAIMAVRGDAAAIKAASVAIEQTAGYGRLFDIDVFDANGRQLSRASLALAERSCLVCQGNALECMRERKHSTEQIMAVVSRLIRCFRAEATQRWPDPVQQIGTAAIEAMLMEAACTPAPGLVDRYNSGAHQDMDFFSFLQSSSAIGPAMYRCAFAAWRHDSGPAELLPVLRLIGADAEAAMLAATGGVNTQKGLIFLLGVVAAATALVWRKTGEKPGCGQVLTMAAAICQGIVAREMAGLKHKLPDRKLTAGERLYMKHGITGIRGEIEGGLSIISEIGLPLLRQALTAGLSVNDALVHTLLGLMTQAEDTTIMNRHDLATLAEVKAIARKIIQTGGMLTSEGRMHISRLDHHFSRERNISPGGSADLLAVTYFLHKTCRSE